MKAGLFEAEMMEGHSDSLDECSTKINQADSEVTPTSFTLGNLHKHLLGIAPAQSHGAEADCEALLRTTAVLGEDWIKYVKDNSYPFATCKKMWGN